MTVAIQAQTPKTAARKTHRALLAYAELIGYSTDHLVLDEAGEAPVIMWEEGPYEWTVSLTGGESLSSAELGYGREPEIDVHAMLDQPWFVECLTSYSLAFYRA